MTTVSCIVVTTLIVVSLANLVLLVHVIMHSVKCDQSCPAPKKVTKIQKRDSFNKDQKSSNYNFKFLAALVVFYNEDENSEFVCGVAIVAKKWVLTSAHCVEPLVDEPRDKLKIFVGEKMKQGVWYDVEKIIIHEGYKSSGLVHNLALISVKQNFKLKEVSFAVLPSRSYKYLAETSATALDWTTNGVVATDVKLLLHKTCQNIYVDQITEEKFCAEKKSCVFDYGGVLLQKNVLVGVVSLGVGCGVKPMVYTRVSLYEEWFKRGKIFPKFKD